MITEITDQIELFEKVKGLNKDQRENVLDYINSIPRASHSTKRYKRRALKQIRTALESV